jgi:short-subunit dehydrogenase
MEGTLMRQAIDWTRQLVWITGGSSGIGAAVARELARRGARLVLSARRGDRLQEVAGSLEGTDHRLMPLDVSDSEAVRSTANRVLSVIGTPTVLVLNAGLSQRSLARDTDLAVDRELMETNYFGAISLVKALLPAMREVGVGRFVVVSSLVGRVGTPLRSGYAASKHALHGFFESLRAEEHDAGLRVTMVCPGFIHTELPRRALTGDGSPQGTMDRAQLEGMAPDECARRIAEAIERDRAEVTIGGKERFVVPLFRIVPALFRRIVRRARVT